MNKIKEITIDEETTYLKKSFGSWKVVYPIKENGKINWKNLISGGSWFNLIKLGIIIGLIILFLYQYSEAIRIANECLIDNPFRFLP